MYQAREYRSSLILAAAVAGVGLLAGCASSPPASQTAVPAHQWDAREDAAYQRYLMDEKLPRRDYASLNAQEQKDYWDWRARNPGN
jgi:NaMN:DMB phosphoribosyltransferase